MGFTGREIQELLTLDLGKTNSCATACHLCHAKIAELCDRIAVLRTAVRELQCVSKTCTYNESGPRGAILCGIIDTTTARRRGQSKTADK